jgi:FMN phosphatase YigB (HAD superfamily)
VADGTVRDARNVLTQHGLNALFDAVVISEAVGAQKPDPSMFHRALASSASSPAATPARSWWEIASSAMSRAPASSA